LIKKHADKIENIEGKTVGEIMLELNTQGLV
jgi:hypothetical protein